MLSRAKNGSDQGLAPMKTGSLGLNGSGDVTVVFDGRHENYAKGNTT